MVNRGIDGRRRADVRNCETLFPPRVVQVVGVTDVCTLQCLGHENVLSRVPHLHFPQQFVRSRRFDMNIPFFSRAASWSRFVCALFFGQFFSSVS